MNHKSIHHKIPVSRNTGIEFELPKNLECSLPTEERGMARDEVRLLVSHYQDDRLYHNTFKSIGDYLLPGDVLVINTSGTLAAALSAKNAAGEKLRIHLSTQRSDQFWVVEIRRERAEGGTVRYHRGEPGGRLDLAGGGQLELIESYYGANTEDEHLRLWVVRFHLQEKVMDYLHQHGKAIRYGYLKKSYPLSYYQTVFAQEPGSAEMPSAGRAFTPELVAQLVARGVVFAPLLLHTGVASLELEERPYDEFYRVPASTAQLVNLARAEGRRVIAVGTTAIRALETMTDHYGKTRAGQGWTNTFITPERGLHGIDGLITGFHEPKASHLLMLETLTGKRHLEHSYHAALTEGYQWHEFGDLHLILP